MKLRTEIEALRDHLRSRGMDTGQAIELLLTHAAGVIATRSKSAGEVEANLREAWSLLDERASALWAQLKAERLQ